MPFDDALKLFGGDDLQPVDRGEGLVVSDAEAKAAKATKNPLARPPREKKAQEDAFERVDSARQALLNGAGSNFKAPDVDEMTDSNPGDDLRRLEIGETNALLGDDQDVRRQRRSGRLKRRGLVPMTASDEDFDLLGGGKPTRDGKSARQKRSDVANTGDDAAERRRSSQSGAFDPFARARKASDSPPSPAKADPFDSNQALESSRMPKAETPKPTSGRAAVSSVGEYGLVLSRIESDSKRKEAAQLISVIQGSRLEEALRLTERTIIPVLKDVSKDDAEKTLEQFRSKQISGRVTRRRSGAPSASGRRRD
jgi:hypothetical protein